jgi:hypothetical protein
MNELDQLRRVRAGVAPMSEHARNNGRVRLAAAMTGDGPPVLQRPVTRRRLTVGLAFGLALTSTLTGALVLGSPEGRAPGQAPANAADVFNRAAATLESHPDQVPRPDQYMFVETRETVSATGPILHVLRWTAVDGGRPGFGRITNESPTCDPRLSSPPGIVLPLDLAVAPGMQLVDGCTYEGRVEAFHPATGLAYNTPYAVLATLPTEPDALLAVLRAGPAAHGSSPSPSATGPAATGDQNIWNLIRELAPRLPSAQRAALFRAAAKLPGARLHPNVTDVTGRTGVGVGVDDPRVGHAVLVFDHSSFRYLGEVVDARDDIVAVSRAELRTAIVDRAGQMP